MNTAHRIDHHGVSLRLLSRFSPYSATDLDEKKQPIRDSFDALKNGRGTEVDFENLDIAFATSLVRSRDIDALCVITATVARDALERCWARYQRLGRFGFDGPALAAVADGIELHEALLDNSTPKQMMDAARGAPRVVSLPLKT
ncbi:MAG: hypothetical protein Q8R67_05275 [Rhodoferax sp.]|nr:hypothetical protein [Rhodoferax sp.]MDP3651078.1 hypothetical protein [Rhodoferax sp.]